MKLINLINPTINFAELAMLCQQTDTLLLRQDAVYLAARSDIKWPSATVLALDTDLSVRQLLPHSAIGIVSAVQWVELTATASQVLLWR
ncbi:DsrH/TusB family sulfur metabolism protein [Arsukibacterium sp.]|uniref:DsrH/TusB family sulfur metabolism protein n=1 Tax=Arsukibacterium sp. TaxID=1977258 RepID=UPI00299F50DE|nr:DsrH/TusB family sulfur metabolism protein [Arsukibacterium sp.]MDX1677847.1 DsrH/TusB family sulfur metabolism protein [Arsukibacterium sp.]